MQRSISLLIPSLPDKLGPLRSSAVCSRRCVAARQTGHSLRMQNSKVAEIADRRTKGEFAADAPMPAFWSYLDRASHFAVTDQSNKHNSPTSAACDTNPNQALTNI